MFNLSRLVIAYAVSAFLALVLGYLVYSSVNLALIAGGGLLAFLCIPVLLRWHHFLLIALWSTAFYAPFLPGAPDLSLIMSVISFTFAFLNHVVFQKRFLRAPELTKPVVFLLAVVMVTAWARGGIGIRSMGGSAYGGKYYLWVIGAILGYFALTSQRVSLARGPRMAGVYLLGGLTQALPNLIYLVGPGFYFLYFIVHPFGISQQVEGDRVAGAISRLNGLAPAASAAVCYMLSRWGVRGLFNAARPWRLALFLFPVVISCFAGFRSAVILLFITTLMQMHFEGSLRSALAPAAAVAGILLLVPVLVFSDKMPRSVQRTISFLPVNVAPEVREDAHDSSEWRFKMWAEAAKDIPRYFLLGKGYTLDPAAIGAVMLEQQLGLPHEEYEGSLLAGDYHSGPLSVILPFGVFGSIAFLWTLAGGYRVLHNNFRHGDARLRHVNTFLIAYYVTQVLAFFFIFGALYSQLAVFLGICGLSVSLNGGVCRKAAPARRRVSVQPARGGLMTAI